MSVFFGINQILDLFFSTEHDEGARKYIIIVNVEKQVVEYEVNTDAEYRIIPEDSFIKLNFYRQLEY